MLSVVRFTDLVPGSLRPDPGEDAVGPGRP